MTVSAPTTQPRLGLIHLFVCTGIVAAYFGITRELQMDQATDPYESALWTLWSIGAGVSICGLVLCVSRCVRRRPFLTQPGEWLWSIVGVVAALRLSVQAVAPVQDSQVYTSAVRMIGPVALSVSFALAAKCTRIRHWRWYFVSCLAFCLAMFSIRATRLVDVLSYSVPAFLLVLVVGIDLMQRRRYTWSHWTGVAIWPWFSGVAIAWLLYAVFIIEPALDAMSGAT